MNVMKLGDRGVARFQHLDISLCGNRLEGIGIDVIEECVHRLPPRPEAVARCARASRAASERALKRMRVQIRHARYHRGRGVKLHARGSIAATRATALPESGLIAIGAFAAAPSPSITIAWSLAIVTGECAGSRHSSAPT